MLVSNIEAYWYIIRETLQYIGAIIAINYVLKYFGFYKDEEWR